MFFNLALTFYLQAYLFSQILIQSLTTSFTFFLAYSIISAVCVIAPIFSIASPTDFWDMSAIVEAAQEAGTPIFLACLPKVIEAIGINKLGVMAKTVMEESNVPVIYHLDHCHSVELCLAAVNYGYKSVMIDAADLPLEKNIAAVKKVVEYAHAKGVHVEAEIGKIKSAGAEGYTPEETLARVEEAKR